VPLLEGLFGLLLCSQLYPCLLKPLLCVCSKLAEVDKLSLGLLELCFDLRSLAAGLL
jgi:hypothetical protein